MVHPRWQVYDLAQMIETPAKSLDIEGAGRSFMSPRWLTELGRLWGGKSVRADLLVLFP